MSKTKRHNKRTKLRDCYLEVQLPKRFNDSLYVTAINYEIATAAIWDSIKRLRLGETISITKQADRKLASDIHRGRLKEWDG